MPANHVSQSEDNDLTSDLQDYQLPLVFITRPFWPIRTQ